MFRKKNCVEAAPAIAPAIDRVGPMVKVLQSDYETVDYTLSLTDAKFTYKELHLLKTAEVEKYKTLLDDLLLIDPSLQRFRGSQTHYTRYGTSYDLEEWRWVDVAEAATVLRQDVADAKRREVLGTFKKPKKSTTN